jgi:hypothetical protein
MPTTFPNAVRTCNDIQDQHLKSGLGALTLHYRKKVTQGDGVRISGSVFLDEALREISGHGDKCVDYAVGVQLTSNDDDRVIFLEIHEANDGSAKTVKEKFDFIVQWLTDGGASLGCLKHKQIWVASGASHLSQAKRRMLNAVGIIFQGGHLTINKKLFS